MSSSFENIRARALLFLFPFLFPIIFFGVSDGFCEDRIYYSIHLESFKNIKNANSYVNALKNKGKLLFWKKTDIPGKGLFYRVYIGKYDNQSEAVEFWKKLKEEAAVSYFGVHKFTEKVNPVLPIKTEALPFIEKKEHHAQPVPEKTDSFSLFYPFPSAQAKDRFVDNQDGTVIDTQTKLMWIKNGWRLDFFSAVSWWEANKKCEAFRHAGFDNWRLPTINEWKSLIDTNNQYPALIEPNPFENIIAHMPYWTKTDFIYSGSYTCNVACPIEAYTVMLYSGNMNHQKKTDKAFILPVRLMD